MVLRELAWAARAIRKLGTKQAFCDDISGNSDSEQS